MKRVLVRHLAGVRLPAVLVCWVLAIALTLVLGGSAWLAIEDASESAQYFISLQKSFAS